MNKIVIYPGRFHPFHKGHFASYQFLVREYGADSVYIASTNSQAPLTSPFSFEEKKQMAGLLGVPEDKFVQVKNPYRSEEITGRVNNPEDTVLIFAVSEKDVGRFTFTKKDGTPSYMQPMPKDEAQMKGMTDNAYVTLTPTVTFKVQGQDANSASQIRSAYVKADEAERKDILKDLYGTVDKNVKAIFDKKMSVVEQLSLMMTTLKESRDPMDANMRKVELALEMERQLRTIEEADMDGHYLDGDRIVPAGGQGSWDEAGLRTNIAANFAKFVEMFKHGNYGSLYHELYKNKAFQSKLEALTLHQGRELPKK